MVKLNLKDGSILKVDLKNDSDRALFNKLGQSHSSKPSETVTGIWFLKDDSSPAVTLPIPSRFRRVFFYLEPLTDREGEKRGDVIWIQADDVGLVVTKYHRDGMYRIDLKHTGKSRFSPGREQI